MSAGQCGCGVVDTDTDADGVADCIDNCVALSNPTQADCDVDAVGDVCEIAGGSQFDLDLNGVPDDCQPSPGDAYCSGDGSAAACPCANLSISGEGCANSTGLGSKLINQGGASCSLDDASFLCTQVPPNQPGILYMGTAWKNGCLGQSFGNGLRGGAGQLQRFGGQSAGAGGTYVLTQPVAASGGSITPGSTWYFQAWHRDLASPCAAQLNLSNGWRVTFAP